MTLIESCIPTLCDLSERYDECKKKKKQHVLAFCFIENVFYTVKLILHSGERNVEYKIKINKFASFLSSVFFREIRYWSSVVIDVSLAYKETKAGALSTDNNSVLGIKWAT